MEDRGFYEAALREYALHGDAATEFESQDEIIDDLRETVKQLQLAVQMSNRKAEALDSRLRKIEQRVSDVEASASQEQNERSEG